MIFTLIVYNNKNLHVLQYPADLARTQWELAINKLEATLVTLRTNTAIIKVWKSRLLGWQDKSQFPFSTFILGETTFKAVKEQDYISWKNFYEVS